ncbi:MAG: hypothetical protein HYR90_00155 [Candidatus Andersenbacteria bacterium]|nr:hypothetical protein [Candidatus Andersenbacteria bacterium]MBI3251141.1 hypothetical protein [Candidatus Andersenbacteria bacterium]
MGITETIAVTLRALTLVALYVIIGFGPGFVIGVMLGNRFGGGYKHPVRMDLAKEQIEKAMRHNAQWHPDNERWKK